MITVLPAMLTWDRGHPWRLSRYGMPGEAALILSATVAVSWVSLMSSDHAYVLISLPLLVAAFRLNVVGTALASLCAMLSVMAIHRWFLPEAIGLRSVNGSSLPFQPSMMFGLCSVLPAILIAIDERTRAATAHEREALARRIALIADNVPAFIGHIDRDMRYRLLNRRYAEWFDRTVDELIGMRQSDLLGDRDEYSLRDRLEGAFAGERQVFEANFRGRDLEVHYIPDEVSNEPRAGVFVMAHDITDRKVAERALFEEKERAQVTLDSIGDGVVACDNAMRITSLNPTAVEMTGWSAARRSARRSMTSFA